MFYSWQCDRPNRTNRSFIELALASAVKAVGVHLEVVPVLDRDTANQPGSPEIAQSILDKIREADVFVADVSIIGSAGSRKTSNPNVLAELGYAVGVLGWERVLLLFNSHFGSAEDLPFDIRHRRALDYADDDTEHERGSVRTSLARRLESAIRQICLAEEQGRLPPTLRSLREERVRDRTLARPLKPTLNLRRMNSLLGWGHSNAELEPNIEEVNAFAERLRLLPLPAAGALAVVLRRATSQGRLGRAVALYDDVLHATGLTPEVFASLVTVLEEHSFVSVDDDREGRVVIRLSELRSGWPLLEDVRAFCAKSKLPPERLVEDLEFDLLDT